MACKKIKFTSIQKFDIMFLLSGKMEKLNRNKIVDLKNLKMNLPSGAGKHKLLY